MMEAAILGLIRYRTGSILICIKGVDLLEMRRIAISAAMEEPALAVIMMAASTGPIL